MIIVNIFVLFNILVITKSSIVNETSKIIKGNYENREYLTKIEDNRTGINNYNDQLNKIWSKLYYFNEPYENIAIFREKLTVIKNTSNKTSHYFQEISSDTDRLKRIIYEYFSSIRHHKTGKRYKEIARSFIVDKLTHYTSETYMQYFDAFDSKGNILEGVNVIGIVPGYKRGTREDSLIVIGAHYDTVKSSPGVNDNGSGMASLLEIARVISLRKEKYNSTIIYVAFDLEEEGILGSLAFVNKFLVPKELNNHNARFIGAYILDGLLNYDPVARAQILPFDIATTVPEAFRWLLNNSFQGDFISVWSRRSLDFPLWYAFKKAWLKSNTDIYKVLILDPPIPKDALLISNLLYRQFLRAGHAAFWNNRHRGYPETLSAALITDMGPWRGRQRVCYHEFCDDLHSVNDRNLDFLKAVTDILVASVISLARY